MELNVKYNPLEAKAPESMSALLPKDWYLMRIDAINDRESQSNSENKYAEVTLTVVGADYTGRKVWAKIHYQNANEKTQSIGAHRLRTLMESCGVSTPNTDLMIGKTVYANVYTEKGSNGFSDKNEVREYKPVGTPVAAATNSKAPF